MKNDKYKYEITDTLISSVNNSKGDLIFFIKVPEKVLRQT
jgi:hypothetical protein